MDKDKNGTISYAEFASWQGKDMVLRWIDEFCERILSCVPRAFRHDLGHMHEQALVESSKDGGVRQLSQYPWDGLTESVLERVFRSESWQGTLTLVEFERFLNKLGLDGQALGSRLFAAFDGDANGYLDWKEVFIGMALLLPAPWKTKVKCAFGMMDEDSSGFASPSELERFVKRIAPLDANQARIKALAREMMSGGDINRNGQLSYDEFEAWEGKRHVLQWIDAFIERVLAHCYAPVIPKSKYPRLTYNPQPLWARLSYN